MLEVFFLVLFGGIFSAAAFCSLLASADAVTNLVHSEAVRKVSFKRLHQAVHFLERSLVLKTFLHQHKTFVLHLVAQNEQQTKFKKEQIRSKLP